MITILNAIDIHGKKTELQIPSTETTSIDAKGRFVMPAVIDPHVHFRTPGLEHKENWESASRSALRGGVAMVFDMPNTIPPTTTHAAVLAKKEIIDKQLKHAKIPLRYGLYFGADKAHFDEIPKVKNDIIGLKVFMGSSTGGLVMDDDSSLHAIFALASAHDLIISVHAEDEHLIEKRKSLFQDKIDYHTHSELRSPEVAVAATKKAIDLARMYKTRLNILHLSTKDEISLIKQAKKEGLHVTAETTPHHLFLCTELYKKIGGYAQVNPPLRSADHGIELMKAVQDGTIDMIGSDHAPHTKEEKERPYGKCPSGFPGTELLLPLLLEAYHQGLLSLQKIVEITSQNTQKIFRLPKTSDIILVDLNEKKTVSASTMASKCNWSPYEGTVLRGWPSLAVVQGNVFDLKQIPTSV